MATVKIKMSQAVIDKNNQLEGTTADTSPTISDALGSMVTFNQILADAFYYSDNYQTTRTQLIFTYGGGARKVLTGTAHADFDSGTYGYGTAVATSHVLSVPRAFKETINGTLNYDYEYDTSGIELTATGGTVSAYKLETLVADPDLGLVSMGFNGALGYNAAQDLSGSINKIYLTGQKHLKSLEINGSFGISGNMPDIANGDTIGVNGTMQSYKELYVDGSSIEVTTSLAVDSTTVIDQSALADESNWAGDDNFSIELPARLFSIWEINTGLGHDTITVKGGGGLLHVNTGDGDDYVRMLDNAPVVDGGAGNDTLELSVTGTLGLNFENLVLAGKSNISGTGNAQVNTLTGNTAANTLDGGAGADTLIGATGNDIYLVDDAADIIIERANQGTDTVRASVYYSLADNVESLELTGGSNLNATGNALVNTLTGNSGNNVLDGGLNGDRLVGGAGNDTYQVDNIKDVVVELAGGGDDRIETSLSTFTLAKTLEVEGLLFTGSGRAALTGNARANYLEGASGNDTLNGLGGADTLVGGAGNDTLFVDDVLDVVTELSGEGFDIVNSTVSYTLGNDIEQLALTGNGSINATGNNGDNTLLGNTSSNSLTGLDGNDILDGLGGNDMLIGGNGNDMFRLSVAPNAATNRDVILDFVSGEDLLYISKSAFKWTGAMGQIAVDAFVSGAGLTGGIDTSDRFVYDTNTGTLSYDVDGSGRGKAQVFAVLNGAPLLSYDDIVIY